MNLALIGYGKMGKAIEEIALQRGHTIVLKIDIDNADQFTKENLAKADVAIEFTGPHSAFDNVKKLMQFGTATVCGSTGWLEKLNEIENDCKKNSAAFLYASNFSVGVNIFFEVNKRLASLMKDHEDYEIQLTEIHHTAKKDAPSGTAITLAEQVLENGLAPGSLLNVNFPKSADIKGIKICRQANAKWAEEFDERLDPYKRQYYWLTGVFQLNDHGEDTDVYALSHNYVSVVPVQFDMTAHHVIPTLNSWTFNV